MVLVGFHATGALFYAGVFGGRASIFVRSQWKDKRGVCHMMAQREFLEEAAEGLHVEVVPGFI